MSTTAAFLPMRFPVPSARPCEYRARPFTTSPASRSSRAQSPPVAAPGGTCHMHMRRCDMQTQSRFFDDLARVAHGALSAAAGVRTEIEQMIRQQFERFLADRDLVSRDEFEAVEAMAARARQEQEDRKSTRLNSSH